MKKNRLKYVIAAMLLCVLFAACGQTDDAKQAGTEEQTDSPEPVEVVADTDRQNTVIANDVIENEIDEVETEETEEKAESGETVEDDMKEVRELKEEEVLEFIKGASGIDFSGYINGASGVTYSNLYYVRLDISQGMENAVDEMLKELCGEGFDPSERTIPRANNRICDEMRRIGPAWGYQYMHAGQGGAKTAETTFYTAVENGETSLFVFGY